MIGPQGHLTLRFRSTISESQARKSASNETSETSSVLRELQGCCDFSDYSRSEQLHLTDPYSHELSSAAR